MKKKEQDILKERPELKKMPYSIPDGYFEQFKAKAYRQQTVTVSLWNRLAPYAATAAIFLFLVSAGTFILERTTADEGMTQEDYILFSDNLMNTISYDDYSESQLAEAEINEEDIINYLIYSGISPEEVELSK